MTRPSRGVSGQASSTALAIAAEALPAPTTTTWPCGGGGRCAGTVAAGKAASTAASNMALRRSRGGLVTLLSSAYPNGAPASAPDLVVSHDLQRADHGRMVPGRASVRRTRVEQLLRVRRVRQAQLQLPGSLQGQIEIFLVQLDAEARIEGALDHALAVQLEDARAGEAAHERLAHLGRVRPRLGGEEQRFADGLDGQRHNDLVGDLRGLAITVAADESDVLAHELEQGLHLFEGALGPADHDGERGLLGPDLAARDRRVEVIATLLVDAPGEVFGGNRRDRAHVDNDLAGRKALRDSARAEERRLHMRCVRHHRDDDLGVFGNLPAGAARHRALSEHLLRWRIEVVQEQFVAYCLEMPGHGPAHDAKTEKSDFHRVTPLRCGCARGAVGLEPAEPLGGAGLRLVLAANPARVAFPVKRLEQDGEIDL